MHFTSITPFGAPTKYTIKEITPTPGNVTYQSYSKKWARELIKKFWKKEHIIVIDKFLKPNEPSWIATVGKDYSKNVKVFNNFALSNHGNVMQALFEMKKAEGTKFICHVTPAGGRGVDYAMK